MTILAFRLLTFESWKMVAIHEDGNDYRDGYYIYTGTFRDQKTREIRSHVQLKTGQTSYLRFDLKGQVIKGIVSAT
ncbi:MAG: hypothetical protein ACPGED_08145 [Flavobacteriales bacterium]